MKVLLVGETWTTLSTHIQGFDHVTVGKYHEAGIPLINALRDSGMEVDHMPSHTAHFKFPHTVEELKQYNAVIFSDVGSNTLLLHPKMHYECVRMPNRLKVIKEYVIHGGGFLMCGGYMSYSGFEGKARYGMTPIADIMPVTILNYDDRVECPDGIYPTIVDASHPVLKGVDNSSWPDFLGYNKLSAKPGAQLIAKFDDDVFMAGMDYGNGRTFAFATDCVPHWGTPEFVEWEGYNTLFNNIIKWIAKMI